MEQQLGAARDCLLPVDRLAQGPVAARVGLKPGLNLRPRPEVVADSRAQVLVVALDVDVLAQRVDPHAAAQDHGQVPARRPAPGPSQRHHGRRLVALAVEEEPPAGQGGPREGGERLHCLERCPGRLRVRVEHDVVGEGDVAEALRGRRGAEEGPLRARKGHPQPLLRHGGLDLRQRRREGDVENGVGERGAGPGAQAGAGPLLGPVHDEPGVVQGVGDLRQERGVVELRRGEGGGSQQQAQPLLEGGRQGQRRDHLLELARVLRRRHHKLPHHPVEGRAEVQEEQRG